MKGSAGGQGWSGGGNTPLGGGGAGAGGAAVGADFAVTGRPAVPGAFTPGPAPPPMPSASAAPDVVAHGPYAEVSPPPKRAASGAKLGVCVAVPAAETVCSTPASVMSTSDQSAAIASGPRGRRFTATTAGNVAIVPSAAPGTMVTGTRAVSRS